jgi:predicted deacylase
MLSGAAALAGIVPLVAEAGGAATIDATIPQAVECSLNILKHLNMIDGQLVLPTRQIMVANYTIMRSRTGGFYLAEPGVRLGVEVRKGDLLGRVIDPLTSEVTEECRAPTNGVIISRRVIMPINPGGYVVHVADTDSIIWERTNS